MHFMPSFITVTSLSAASRVALALRCLGTAAPSTKGRLSNTARYLAGSSQSSDPRSCESSSSSEQRTCVVSAALAFLEGKKRIVECLSASEYARVDERVGASVGGHMRHTLDHFAHCLGALPPTAQLGGHGTDFLGRSRKIRYDQRMRGGAVETDPREAAKLIVSFQESLRALPRGNEGSLALRATAVAPAFMIGDGEGGEGGEHEFESNLERELFFCCHHGTHHDAMIQLIMKRMGGGAAERAAGIKGLGVAPSTAGFRVRQEGGESADEGSKDA